MKRAVALGVLLGLVAGCATVQPWQRERLSRPCMQTEDPAGTAAWEAHVRTVRVGDVRASSVGGGGCGCN